MDRAELIDIRTELLANTDNFARACVEIVQCELREVYPDLAGCAEAMMRNGMPQLEAFRIIGRCIDHMFHVEPAGDEATLVKYVEDGRTP